MSPPLPAPGTLLGDRYRLDRILGEGGMGRVFLAEQLGTARPCAVKIMRASLAHDADAFARFQREAANAARVRHANVATVYDFGMTDDGVSYLAMEYVEGESLAALLRREGALHPERAARIIHQAAEGLTAAHALGIIHRDLKPDNLLVERDLDGLDQVKIADFGIAKTVTGPSQTVTTIGAVIGTPEYMSPEQLAGEVLDARSDVFSLAVVAFQMLTGSLPHPAVTSRETLVKRLTHPARKLAEVRPDIAWTAALQRAFDAALTPDAALRYPTVRDFARHLSTAIAAAPAPAAVAVGASATTVVANAPQSPMVDATVVRPIDAPLAGTPSTARAPRRWPRAIGLASAMAFVLVLGVPLMWQLRDEQAPAIPATLERDLARASRSTAALQGGARTPERGGAQRRVAAPPSARQSDRAPEPIVRTEEEPVSERPRGTLADELQTITDAARRHDYEAVAGGLRDAVEQVRAMRQRFPGSNRVREAERAVWLTGLSALNRCRSAASGGVVDASECAPLRQLVPADR